MSLILSTPPAPLSSPPPPQVSSLRYGFADATLGESLADWRSAKPLRASIPCMPRPSNLMICRGMDQPVGGGYFARQVDYSFVNDRLVGIAYRTSIDAFDNITARLKEAYGPPTRIVYDRIKDALRTRAHVRMEWTNGRSTIVLSDPIPDATELKVNLTLDDASKRVADVG